MHLDDCVCVLPDLTWLPLLGVGRKSWYIIMITLQCNIYIENAVISIANAYIQRFSDIYTMSIIVMIAHYIKALINKRKLIIITYRTNSCRIIWCNGIWYYSCDTVYWVHLLCVQCVHCTVYHAVHIQCLPVKVLPYK